MSVKVTGLNIPDDREEEIGIFEAVQLTCHARCYTSTGDAIGVIVDDWWQFDGHEGQFSDVIIEEAQE